MFNPKRIIFLKDTMEYNMGRKVYDYFRNNDNVEKIFEDKNTIRNHFDQENFVDFYHDGKKTLVLGVKKIGPFQSCKPSADYQLPLVSGCMGQCEYCYLQTQLAKNPYVKVNVNIEEILNKALDYVNISPNSITLFEGTATSDILPIEPYTNILANSIAFFANIENARLRIVSKYNDVDTLLNLKHNDHTEIRFSINTDTVIKQYEHLTPSAKKRIEAAKKVLKAGYRVGFLIAPVFLYENYQEDYYQLLEILREEIKGYEDKVTFEIISHRFTPRAKESILEVFPNTSLDLDESQRTYRMGQFGYGKYMYTTEELRTMKTYFKGAVNEVFPNSNILYII